MSAAQVLPMPDSTYQLLLEAARTWPDRIATQWIPEPGDHAYSLAWAYPELAGTVTQIANALTALGVRRQDAVGYLTDPGAGGPQVSREDVVRDGWLNTGDLGSVDADGFVYLAGRAKDLIIRGGHNIDPKTIEEALLAHPAVAAAAAVGRPDQHSGEVPVAYVVPADAGQFDEAELLAWAGTAIAEPAARPKRIYPITAIPVTAIGKPYKPALAADAAVCAVTEVLAAAGLTPGCEITAAREDGRLAVTVAGADPARVQEAVAGFPLTVRCVP